MPESTGSMVPGWQRQILAAVLTSARPLPSLPTMNVVRHKDADYSERLRQITAASSLFDPDIEESTRALLDLVRERGDDALLELTERFDGARLEIEQLRVGAAELLTASLKADDALRAAVTEARENIARFAKKSRRKDWWMRNSHRAGVRAKVEPFQRVRSCTPR